MDRPSRKTKTVNYCESRDPDDDEDFAFSNAPPSKKPRESGKQEGKKSSSKPSSQESQSTASQQSRKPLNERLHDRDLEAALTLSFLNNSNDRMDQAKCNGVAKVQVVADENTDPKSLHLSNCCVDSTTFGLEEISAEKESLSKQRKAAAKAAEESRKTLKNEDKDYEPKPTPESDSDEEFSEPAESEDEEFTVKNVSKTKKKAKEKSGQVKAAPAPKKTKPSSKPAKSKTPGGAATTTALVRSPPVAKVAPKRPVSCSSVPSSRPALSPIPAGGRVPKWNPPGQVGRSPSSSQTPAVRSPGQGLRLGLSRLVRVKPLHPSAASH